MQSIAHRVVLAVVVTVIAVSADLTAGSAATVEAETFDFGRVMRGSVVEPVFVLRNADAVPLPVHSASMTPPLVATALPAVVPAEGAATLRFRLDTTTLQGDVDIAVAISTGDATTVRRLAVRGYVVPPIEFVPGALFFLGATRGEPKAQSIEVINHETEPLGIVSVDAAGAPLTTEVETIEDGRRYRVTVRTTAETPVGRRADPILLTTTRHAMPRIALRAHTLVHERVYTFPDEVDLGAMTAAEVRANPVMVRALGQKLMVYGPGTTDFTIAATTDVAGVVLKAERAPSGDRWQITATLDPERVPTGPLSGHITVTTNDRDFPQLKVPVVGELLP